MPAKLITYDLDSPGQSYPKIIDAIQSYPNCVKMTESCWIINTNATALAIRDNLKQYIDSNDRILVADLTGKATGINVLCTQDEFTKVFNF
ncbi:SinR family protein [Priestia megaterium]|uniref:CRISPR-associated protein Cas2 n=1 Tax=Priestia megaterium TaxID=1404 RepID=UPI001EDBDDCD|nr:CRISPR-associated protein Cas2 [Priestia megaterium]UKJ82884.1 SinR family protein [Priestia megaterium]